MIIIKFIKFCFYFLVSISFYLMYVLIEPIGALAHRISEWATQQLEGIDE
jgi:hypothetical protein